MPGMDLSDNELAVLAGKGNAEAYRRLFERYQHPVYNFVYRLVDNAEDAADIVQDAFIRMYSVLGATEVQNFSAYLYRTAKNLAYDEMRRRSRFADVDQEMLAPEDPSIYADPQRALLLGEQIETVRRAAGGLNENQRAALILRELQDMDYDQMSDVLESNRNAVGALLSRARLKFREELRMAQISTDQCPDDCEEIVALLSPYIDGELGDEEKQRVESHLEGCAYCKDALEQMNEASRSFRMFIPVIAPPSVAQAFTGRLAELTGQGGVEAGQGEAGQGGGEAAQGGEALDATQVQYQNISGTGDTQMYPRGTGGGRGGGSRFSRVLRSKGFWIITGAVILFLLFAGMVAWGLSGNNGSDTTKVPTTSTRTATTRTSTQTDTDSSVAPAPVEDTTPTTPTTRTTPTTPDNTSTTDQYMPYPQVTP